MRIEDTIRVKSLLYLAHILYHCLTFAIVEILGFLSPNPMFSTNASFLFSDIVKDEGLHQCFNFEKHFLVFESRE